MRDGKSSAKSVKEGRISNLVPANKALPQKTIAKKQRYTQSRTKVNHQTLKPGTNTGRSFVKLYETEAQCAAYCGFEDVADFRSFAASPYTLTFFNFLHPVRDKARRAQALTLLIQVKTFDLHWISDETPESKYPANYHRVKPHYQLAFISVKMKRAIEKVLFTDADVEAPRSEFEQLTGRKMPAPPALERLKMPKLGPFDGETDIEPYNRIMNILLYVRLSTNNSNWKHRFGNTDWALSRKLRQSDLPDWMREPPDQPTNTSPVEEVRTTEVQIRWAWQDDEQEQQAYLAYAEEAHKTMFFEGQPRTTTVTVTLDSRMCVEQLRDAIRIAFDVSNTEANLADVWLEDDELILLTQAEYGEWESVKTSVLDGSRKALFAIMLRKRERHECVFEFDGPPLSYMPSSV